MLLLCMSVYLVDMLTVKELIYYFLCDVTMATVVELIFIACN